MDARQKQAGRPRVGLTASLPAFRNVAEGKATPTMGKKGKKAQAGKPKKLTPKDVSKRLDALAKILEEELEGVDLFAPPPPTEDCAICLVPLSRVNSQTFYQPCCGNNICVACYIENEKSLKKQNEENTGKKIVFACPFCREPIPTSNEEFAQLQARCLKNDHKAHKLLGVRHQRGTLSTPKNNLKALDYFIRSVELGSPEACKLIGSIYSEGNGVNVDKERAALFGRIAALRGSICARNDIGVTEYESGNYEVGICHWKIAAEAGDQDSLNSLKKIYNSGTQNVEEKIQDWKAASKAGQPSDSIDALKKLYIAPERFLTMPGKEFISKEYLEKLYRVCHASQEEIKSGEREKHSDLLDGMSELMNFGYRS